MTFKQIMADKKAKRWAYLCWSGSVLVLLINFYTERHYLLLTSYIYAAWLVVIPFTPTKNKAYPEYFTDPLNQLRLEGKMLHVKQHQVEIAHVGKVAIDQIDEKTAFIDFPYTMFGKLKFSFPASELTAVKAFFKQHCPDIEIIR